MCKRKIKKRKKNMLCKLTENKGSLSPKVEKEKERECGSYISGGVLQAHVEVIINLICLYIGIILIFIFGSGMG